MDFEHLLKMIGMENLQVKHHILVACQFLFHEHPLFRIYAWNFDCKFLLHICRCLGLGIYDTMQYITPDVATICTGIAASMGAVLLCAGEKGKRSALPHARVMIHQPLGGAQGQASDIEITAREIMKLKKELYDIIANHSGQEFDKVHHDSDRDYWMKAEEAKAYGMVDEVLTK